MNLFINILIVYLLPLLLYALGKNEYMEDADEHRLSQHSKYHETKASGFGMKFDLILI